MISSLRGCEVDLGALGGEGGVLFPMALSATAVHILDIFGKDNKIAVTDPVYPVYVDTNVMAGHMAPQRKAGNTKGWSICPSAPKTTSPPAFPNEKVRPDFTSASPNNPTGAVATKEHLQAWVNYARAHGSILSVRCRLTKLSSPIPPFPHSIYEIEGARGLCHRVPVLL